MADESKGMFSELMQQSAKEEPKVPLPRWAHIGGGGQLPNCHELRRADGLETWKLRHAGCFQ